MGKPRPVTVGAAATLLCTKRRSRKGLHIQNTHAANPIFLGGPGVTVTTGIELVAKALISWNLNDWDRVFEWYVVSAAGGEIAMVVEIS